MSFEYKPVVYEYYKTVSHLPGMSLAEANNYLYTLLSRNAAIGGGRLVNTRFTDASSQPIYILYVGDSTAPIDLASAVVVRSLSVAKHLYPALTDTHLPQPLQWGPTSSYLWDPDIPLIDTPSGVISHIWEHNHDRLPQELKDRPIEVFQRFLSSSLLEGVERVKRDYAYAIPMYSRKHDCINMLLPFRVMSTETELPEAVFVIGKTIYGYQLFTVLTPQQAYVSARTFRDPENTWLKGALPECET